MVSLLFPAFVVVLVLGVGLWLWLDLRTVRSQLYCQLTFGRVAEQTMTFKKERIGSKAECRCQLVVVASHLFLLGLKQFKRSRIGSDQGNPN